MSEIQNIYWCEKGKFQKAYDYFYPKLVPTRGYAKTPEGELLRIISKVYYRYYNDGDYYDSMIEDGYEKLTSIKDIDKKFLNKLENILYNSYEYQYEQNLEETVDKILRYIILKNSTPTKIFNIDTRRLVSIETSKGVKILESLNCKLYYSYDL